MAMSPAPHFHDHRILQFPQRLMPRRLTVSTEDVAEYTSIQDAIDDANAGDTIVIGAGMYLESLIIDKPVHLVGPTDPRFGDEEMAAGEDAPYALIIGVDDEAIVWAADGGSIRDIAVSLGAHDDDEDTTLLRVISGNLQMRRCVLADGAQHGLVVERGRVEVSRTHIRNVGVGVGVLEGEADLERTHIEGPEIVAVNVEPAAGIALRDNCFEGRTMLRGRIHAFTGNDMDTLFVDETISTSGNRVGSLVHPFDFRSVGDVAVGI